MKNRTLKMLYVALLTIQCFLLKFYAKTFLIRFGNVCQNVLISIY